MMGMFTVLSAQEARVYNGYKELVTAVKQEIDVVEPEGFHEKYVERIEKP